MSRAKIAPTLAALLSDLWHGARERDANPGDAQILRIAESELRALLAVAQAARRVEKTRVTWQPEATALRAAIDRLARISGGGR